MVTPIQLKLFKAVAPQTPPTDPDVPLWIESALNKHHVFVKMWRLFLKI